VVSGVVSMLMLSLPLLGHLVDARVDVGEC